MSTSSDVQQLNPFSSCSIPSCCRKMADEGDDVIISAAAKEDEIIATRCPSSLEERVHFKLDLTQTKLPIFIKDTVSIEQPNDILEQRPYLLSSSYPSPDDLSELDNNSSNSIFDLMSPTIFEATGVPDLYPIFPTMVQDTEIPQNDQIPTPSPLLNSLSQQRIDGTSLDSMETVHSLPLELNNSSMIEQDCQLFETLFKDIESLMKDEHVLLAHCLFVKLMKKLDHLLQTNSLSVFALIRRPYYLSKLNQLHSNQAQIFQEEITSSDSIGHQDIDLGQSLITPRHLSISALGSAESFDSTHIWGRSPSIMSFMMRKDHLPDPSHLLSRQLTEKLSHTTRTQSDIHRSFLSRYKYSQESCHHKSIIGTTEMDTFSFAHSILAEPITLCLLPSQLEKSLEIEHTIHQSSTTDVDSSIPLSFEEAIGVPQQHDTEHHHDIIDLKRLQGRTPLRRLVWNLGELPCIAFTTQHLSDSLQINDPNGSHDKSINTDHHIKESLSPSCHASYLNRKIDGLSLPIDIQIIFILASSLCGGHHSTEYVTSDGDFSNKDKQIHNIKQQHSNDSSENLFLLKQQHAYPTKQHFSIKTRRLIQWLHQFLERLVNHPHIHRLRIQYTQTQKALIVLSTDVLKDKTWNVSQTKDCHTIWKMMPDGNALCVIQGDMKVPLFECLSLINESDLHKNWVPFLSESKKVHQISQFCQIIRQRTSLPWPLDDRENVMLGYAIDGLHLYPPSIIMNGASVPDDAVSLFGLSLTPPRPGLTRLRIKFFTFQLLPNKHNKNITTTKFIVYMDPQMNFVPKTVQGFLARQTATRLFTNIQQLCKNFEKTVYAQRVADNKIIYDIVRIRLVKYYDKKDEDSVEEKETPMNYASRKQII